MRIFFRDRGMAYNIVWRDYYETCFLITYFQQLKHNQMPRLQYFLFSFTKRKIKWLPIFKYLENDPRCSIFCLSESGIDQGINDGRRRMQKGRGIPRNSVDHFSKGKNSKMALAGKVKSVIFYSAMPLMTKSKWSHLHPSVGSSASHPELQESFHVTPVGAPFGTIFSRDVTSLDPSRNRFFRSRLFFICI